MLRFGRILVLEDCVALSFTIISQVEVRCIFRVNLYHLGLQFGLHLFILFFLFIVHRAWCRHRFGCVRAWATPRMGLTSTRHLLECRKPSALCLSWRNKNKCNSKWVTLVKPNWMLLAVSCSFFLATKKWESEREASWNQILSKNPMKTREQSLREFERVWVRELNTHPSTSI